MASRLAALAALMPRSSGGEHCDASHAAPARPTPRLTRLKLEKRAPGGAAAAGRSVRLAAIVARTRGAARRLSQTAAARLVHRPALTNSLKDV